MTEQQQQIKDFVMLPRKIRNDYSDGKLTKNEFDVLIWIWLNTNPVNGQHFISYEGLRQDLQNSFTCVNARKIISSLRKTQHIYFTSHKGRAGSFPVYPVDFTLTNGKIQTWEYLKNRQQITTQTPTQAQLDTIPGNNLDAPNHNLTEIYKNVLKDFP